MTGFGRKVSSYGTTSQMRDALAAERALRATPSPSVQTRPMSAFESAALLQPTTARPRKSLAVAYLLWWFAGALAAHRFYLGAFRSAAIMAGLFWAGLLLASMSSKKSSLWVGDVAIPPVWVAMIIAWMVWWVLDLFLIPGVRRRHALVDTPGPFNGMRAWAP